MLVIAMEGLANKLKGKKSILQIIFFCFRSKNIRPTINIVGHSGFIVTFVKVIPGVIEQKQQFVDYEKELFGGDLPSFTAKIKEIAKKQKTHIQDREEVIVAKIEEYRNKKKDYYLENKDKRLRYDKDYRIKKKEDLKSYRKEYYERNKEKILAKQREHRKKVKEINS